MERRQGARMESRVALACGGHRTAVENVAELLLERERVPGDELERVVREWAVKEDLSELDKTKELAFL